MDQESDELIFISCKIKVHSNNTKAAVCVEVTTTDTQAAVNIPALLQVLDAIVAKADSL